MIRGMPPADRTPKRSSVAAWIIYDVGNTLFFTGIVGLLFPLWLKNEQSGDDATLGFTLAVAMALMLVVAPIVGAFSDQGQRRMPFLAVTTFICIAATLMLGSDNLTLALSLFALAVIAINTADIFYNALLTEVSTETNRGTIGGLGLGVGYLGAILAVVIALVFVESRGHVFGFRAVGVLFLLVSTPLILMLKERPRPTPTLTVSERAERTLAQLKATLGNIQRFPGLLRFLIARFWYTWAVNTAATFAVLYATGTVGLSDREVELVLLVGILVAIPSAFIWGMAVDRVGPSRTLSVVLLGWIAVLLVSAGIPWLDLPSDLWWGVGILSGVLVAGIWATDRPYMLRLTSPRYLGQFFGLHSMTSRLSAMTGPFTWGYISVTLDLGQTAAVLSLAGAAVISYALTRGISDKAPKWTEDDVP